MEESVAIDEKLRTFKNKRASFDLIGIEITADVSATVSLPNGSMLIVTSARGDPDTDNPDKRMFAEPQVSVYQDSAIGANQIPSGDNLTPGDYMLWHWIDWGSTDVNNLEISYKTVILNTSGSTQTIIFKTNVRRIIK